MKEIKGEFNTAKVFTDNVEESFKDAEEADISDDCSEQGDLKRWNIQKIIICDDARTFDINNYGKMLEEGRVICEFSPNKSDIDEED